VYWAASIHRYRAVIPPGDEARRVASLRPAPWQSGAASPAEFEQHENQDALIDLHNFWTDRPSLQNLSSSLTYQNALLQRNVLLQTGMNSEHVGILVKFQPYSAKGASLPAVMPAVWATPEFAERVQRKHELMRLTSGARDPGGQLNLTA
jgi:hypothetical protein